VGGGINSEKLEKLQRYSFWQIDSVAPLGSTTGSRQPPIHSSTSNYYYYYYYSYNRFTAL